MEGLPPALKPGNCHAEQQHVQSVKDIQDKRDELATGIRL
jgi:hypothetical protein